MKKLDVWDLDRQDVDFDIKLEQLSIKCSLMGIEVRSILPISLSSPDIIGDSDGVIILADSTNGIYSNSVWGIAERIEALHRGKNDSNFGIYVMPATVFRMPIEEMGWRERKRIVVPLSKFSEPEVVKFLAYEGCNLNCSGCTHFASINKHPHMLSIGELERMLRALKRKFTFVKNIQFLGGDAIIRLWQI